MLQIEYQKITTDRVRCKWYRQEKNKENTANTKRQPLSKTDNKRKQK